MCDGLNTNFRKILALYYNKKINYIQFDLLKTCKIIFAHTKDIVPQYPLRKKPKVVTYNNNKVTNGGDLILI